ncbi:MAG: DUF47 domain-containing protein [Pseudomonas sp.]
MVDKSKIVLALGEEVIALPALVNRALSANDRLKYRFALLQAARSHARRPDLPFSSLHVERLACGVDSAELDTVVGSALQEDGRYRIPYAQELVCGIVEDMQEMLGPLGRLAGGGTGSGQEAEFTARLAHLSEQLPRPGDDLLDDQALGLLTSGDREAGDSWHLLVMDAHKALNQVQGRLAAEHLDGAAVYNIDEADREAVRAFMAGIHQTAPLKFNHPGLGTTATRSGDTLIIQNDIGTTDAHVLVVHVGGEEVTVTYTDVHQQRLQFFQGLFDGVEVAWEGARSREDPTMEDGLYRLCIGHFRAAQRGKLLQFLDLLGSRLVFLIDWNKARKQLKAFLPNEEVIELLSWAAKNGYGHMAFLLCGGQQLLYDTLESAGRGSLRYGEQLHQIIGLPQARKLLQFVLAACSGALLAGRSQALVRDELQAEFFSYFRSAEQDLFDAVVEHASYTVEIAESLRDTWLQLGVADFNQCLAARALRAKDWERRADGLVLRVREASPRVECGEFMLRLASCADDVTDELEEAAFHCTLLPRCPLGHPAASPLAALFGLTLSATQEYLKALVSVQALGRGTAREDMQEFLKAAHRVVDLEKMADDTLRRVRHALLAEEIEARELYVLDAIAGNLERATDALMHTVQMLRDQTLARAAL